jgi:hypothetical protein
MLGGHRTFQYVYFGVDRSDTQLLWPSHGPHIGGPVLQMPFPPSSSKFGPAHAVQTPLFVLFYNYFPLTRGNTGCAVPLFRGPRELRVFWCTALAPCGDWRGRKTKTGPVPVENRRYWKTLPDSSTRGAALELGRAPGMDTAERAVRPGQYTSLLEGGRSQARR